ncbi:hypothetical protein QWJ90_14780, partial [Microbacterium oryzae]|uniref:hypothetical protein n=1 Tax=Microbacterium oryzae TaxID=743009 RepID=UPI0025B04FFE
AVRSPRRRALVAEVLAALPDGFPVADADDAALARAAARFRELGRLPASTATRDHDAVCSKSQVRSPAIS